MPDSEHAYKRILGRNISAARGRLQLSQTAVAARMRNLGFEDWRQQTVANIEKGKRRLIAEEVLGLALCLETTVERLMMPQWADEQVEFPSGISLPQASIRIVLAGRAPEMDKYSQVQMDHQAARGIRWEDNTPVRVQAPYERGGQEQP